jgi:hypothetical protein
MPSKAGKITAASISPFLLQEMPARVHVSGGVTTQQQKRFRLEGGLASTS